MSKHTEIEEVKVFVNRADITFAQDEDVWAEPFLELLNQEGFTMKGGVYIGLEMRRNGRPIGFDYVAVARRVVPMKRPAETMSESVESQFMTHCAFRNGNRGAENWGADFINVIIGSNNGEIPSEWLELAMNNVSDVPSGSA